MCAPIFDGFTEDDSNEEHYARSGLVGGAGFEEDMRKQ
jgi:hypothetical protein